MQTFLGLKKLNDKMDLKNKTMMKNQYFWDLYREYLKSEKWEAKRRMVMTRDRNLCQGCLTAEATQVHHKTYDRVFDEPLFDLVAICKDCHEKIHDGRPWMERGDVFRTTKLVGFEGKIGVIIGHLDDDVIEVEFRDGSKDKLMVWDVTYYDNLPLTH